jgi:hypothetical protein
MRMSATISWIPALAWIAWMAPMTLSPAYAAELSVIELERHRQHGKIEDLFELHQGELLLRVNHAPEITAGPMLVPQSIVYVLNTDGQVRQRVQAPSWIATDAIVRYRNAFAVSRRAMGKCARCIPSSSAPVQILAYDSVADEDPTLLYQTRPGVDAVFMVTRSGSAHAAHVRRRY